MAAAAPSAGAAAQQQESVAFRQWQAENGIKTTTDDHYTMDQHAQKKITKDAPWRKNPKYFNRVHMSALALIKIVMHAKTGQGKAGVISQDKSNWVEVMGLTHGFIKDNAFVVTDSFALPVEANEVECSLSEAAQLYMIDYCSNAEKLGKKEAVVGWYHSHPGYSCYLSGTDVPTQMSNQAHQDPFIALVVDPVRTISTGRVEIKAFRTYPENYTPEAEAADWGDQEAIPQSKIEEFGAHFSKYYEVPITVYRSECDARMLNLLWDRYWTQTLSASPLVTNRHFTDNRLAQLAAKIDKAETPAVRVAAGQWSSAKHKAGGKFVDSAATLSKTVGSTTNDVLQGLLGMAVKDRVFNVPDDAAAADEDPDAERVS
jgi:COP9 signalosome complex subunit 5